MTQQNPAASVENHHQDQIPFHSVIGLNDAVTKLDFLKFVIISMYVSVHSNFGFQRRAKKYSMRVLMLSTNVNSPPSPAAGKPKHRHMEEDLINKSSDTFVFCRIFINEQILHRFGKVAEQGPRGPRTAYCTLSCSELAHKQACPQF